MRKVLNWILVGCCSLTIAAAAWGQAKQKPGLWEVTSTASMAGMPQMPQMPSGMKMPQMGGPMAPQTSQICVTQAMIDKYGGPYSNPQRGNCKSSDVSIKPNGMTAKITCTGNMTATGTVEASWTEAGTTHTTMHLVGNMAMGEMSHPIDMTMKMDSTYKGPDCGTVKPVEMPADK